MKIKVLNSDGKIEELEYNDNIKIARHSASHVLAEAVNKIYKDAILTIGPATDDGFYYDFDNISITAEDLKKIENVMKNIISKNQEMKVETMSKAKALDKMKENIYKTEIINELPDDTNITFYDNGNFFDMCAGPHILNAKDIGAVKLLSTTGAYWRGSEKNKMLTRIYGTCFETEQEVIDYIASKEEAIKRDHNKLGRELEFFTTVDYIGQGLPIMLPKGAKVLQILSRFVEDTEEKRGYLMTKTPFMAKSDLYKISGHWDHYRESMFVLGDEKKGEEVFALRPMTCPFQFQTFLNRGRSYRDLPMKLNETSTLFRNEASGEMHGLIRLRQFTISEGHVICTPEQLEQEFEKCIDLAMYMLKTLGLEKDVTYRLSLWDEENTEKYIGSKEEWDKVQTELANILNHLKIDYTVADGEAAFYGPKLDIQIKNVFGKEDTLITVQVDFQLAKKFEMEYTDSDGKKKTPYIIHRTSIGCYERTLALLIEKYAGALPLWIAPTQIAVMTISKEQKNYAIKVTKTLRQEGFRVILDDSDEKIGYKIRSARVEKIPYMFVIGGREEEEETVSIKTRIGEDLGTIKITEAIKNLKDELASQMNI